jgi:hypothetical protein
MAEWQDVEPVKGAAVSELPSEGIYELNKYIYVVKRNGFLLKHKPTSHWTEKQFNIVHAEKGQELPIMANGKRMTPSQYLIQEVRAVVDHVEMAPDAELFFNDEDGLKVLNIFPPNIPIPDAKLPNPKPFLDHLRWVLNDNQDYVDHVLRWMANVLYRPEKRMNHGILISGAMGAGKSSITATLKRLLVPSAADLIQPEMFTGKFQDHQVGKRLLEVNEVELFGSDRQFNKVKTYFTENRFRIEIKNSPSFTINNFCNYFFISNYADPLPVPKGDRRIFYVHSRIPWDHPRALPENDPNRDDEYWKKLHDDFLDIDGEALGAFAVAKYLKEEILPTLPENFNTTTPPMTADKERMILAAQTTLEQWIEDGLQYQNGPFEPNQIFTWKVMKNTIRHELELVAKQKDASVLAKHGLQRETHTIDGKRHQMCWWSTPEFDAELRELWNDTTTEGRAKLMSYWKSKDRDTFAYNPFLDGE